MSHELLKPYSDAIHACRLLEGLSAVEVEEMGLHVRVEDFAQGDEILTEGLQYQGLWLILRGKCEVRKKAGSAERHLATLEPGHVFGEMSFFEVVPHSASVLAVEPVKTLCLTREEFDKLRSTCPCITEKIAVNVVKLVSERLRRMDNWTCELVNGDKNQQRRKEWNEFRARLYSDVFDS